MKRKKLLLAAFFALLLAGSMLDAEVVFANPIYTEMPAIIILADGTFAYNGWGGMSANIDLSTLPIERNGSVYTLTGNISDCQIKVDCDNIVLDGAGFTITMSPATYSYGTPVSLEPTGSVGRSNVTIKNFKIVGRNGIDMTWPSNCTVTSNTIVSSSGLNMIGDSLNYLCSNNQIINNTFLSAGTGIWLEGSSNVISKNTFFSNVCIFIFTERNNVISDNFFNFVESGIQNHYNATNNFSTKINSIPATPPTPTPTATPKPVNGFIGSTIAATVIITILILLVAITSIVLYRKHNMSN